MARVLLQSLADGVVVNSSNQFSAGATVHVYTTGTTTPVNIYVDNSSGTLLSQPLTTDGVGRIPGFVDGQQTLDIVVTVGATTFPAAQTDAVRGDQTPSLTAGRLTLSQLPAHATTHATGGADPITPASIGAASTGALAGALLAANNLNDVASTSVALGNLGIGSAALQPAGAFLQTANGLADVPDADTARGNLMIPVLRGAQALATANLTLSGLQTVDSYVLLDGDRVLLTGQTAGSQNGPWVTHAGSWVRPNDYPSGGSARSRMIAINGGSAYGGQVWNVFSTSTITIDTTSTSWAKLATGIGAGSTVTSVFGRTGAVAATHGDYSYKFRTVHTWAIQGQLALSSGGSDPAYIPPFFVSVGANDTVQLVKVRGTIGGGTSVACTLSRNGTNITGFTALAITSTPSSTVPTAVTLAEDDEIALVLSSLAGTPSNLSLTVVLEHTIT